MEEKYTADMYLTPDDLTIIENKIEELTIAIQDNIYNGETSSLRPIEVGDNLNNKLLHLSFPRNIYELIHYDNSRRKIVEMDTVSSYIFTRDFGDETMIGRFINLSHQKPFDTHSYLLELYSYTVFYNKGETIDNRNPYINRVRIIAPSDMGTVTSINDTDICRYIQIYEDETIIPNYVKNTYTINELPYIQKIDNIERGIENLGKYFTKPIGWIATKDWLGTINFDKMSTDDNGIRGINIDSFSYQDINRWIHNLNLIEQKDMDNITIWNTNKTQYYWDEEDD